LNAREKTLLGAGEKLEDFETLFSRERSSTGSNDCFVVLVVLVLVVFYPLVI
jgi:hypothetical protein